MTTMLKTKRRKKRIAVGPKARRKIEVKAKVRRVRTLKRDARVASADLEIEAGSGNVFADIGMPNPEEALAKAELARQINLILEAKKITQTEAGRILGIPQPRVSDLARGRLVKFSLDKLLDFAKRLGNDIEIRIAPSRSPTLRVAVVRRAS
jgi:predicted XRE-type DNA-binding protein